MSFEISWVGYHNTGSGRIWGYLRNKEDSWFNPYYSFWGKKDGVIHFQKIRENTLKRSFNKTIMRKKEKYIQDYTLQDHVRNEFEQLQIIRKLKLGN